MAPLFGDDPDGPHNAERRPQERTALLPEVDDPHQSRHFDSGWTLRWAHRPACGFLFHHRAALTLVITKLL